MQDGRAGEERAETYLRLLAEAELRRAGDQLRGLDAAAGTEGWSDRGMPFAVAERALWKVIRTGRILVAADVLDHGYLTGLADDLHAAIRARSRVMLDWDRRRGALHRTMFAPPGRPSLPSGPFRWAMRAAPVGRALRVASGRAPSVLHLMSLVRIGTEAVITVVMVMHWPPDGSSADLEITGAGPHHLPYDRLWAVDDQGTRYRVRFEGPDENGTATWWGIARLSAVPPRGVRRLDLVGDGTRLIRLPVGTLAGRGYPGVTPTIEPVAVPPGERLLVLEAERILASGDAGGPAGRPGPGEIITVLTEAGAIAAGSPVPGQLAALCRRLGAAGHGITVPPAAEIPAPWASVIAHRDAPAPASGPEVFAPLAAILPDVDGARFALAGPRYRFVQPREQAKTDTSVRNGRWFCCLPDCEGRDRGETRLKDVQQHGAWPSACARGRWPGVAVEPLPCTGVLQEAEFWQAPGSPPRPQRQPAASRRAAGAGSADRPGPVSVPAPAGGSGSGGIPGAGLSLCWRRAARTVVAGIP